MVFLNLDWRNNAATRDRYEDFARDCCVENTEKRSYIYMQVCMIGNDSRIEVLHADPLMLSPALFTQVELHGPERSREFRRLWMEHKNGSYYPGIRKFLAPRMRKDADFAHALELVLHEYRAERAGRLEHCGKTTLCAWTWNSNNDVNVYEAMLAQAMRRNFVETNLRDLLAVIISRAPFDKRTWLPVMYQSTTNPDDYVVDDRFSDFTAFCLQIEYAGIKRPRTWHSNITVCGHSLITDPALDNECKHVFCRHVLPNRAASSIFAATSPPLPTSARSAAGPTRTGSLCIIPGRLSVGSFHRSPRKATRPGSTATWSWCSTGSARSRLSVTL